MAPFPAADNQRADRLAHGAEVLAGPGVGVLAGDDVLDVADHDVGLADLQNYKKYQTRSGKSDNCGDKKTPGKEKGHRIARDKGNGDGKHKEGRLPGSTHGEYPPDV